MIIDRSELETSAKDFANRSLRAYLHADNRVILMNAACSMEHLGKAFLTSFNPVLLAEIKNGNFDSRRTYPAIARKLKRLFPGRSDLEKFLAAYSISCRVLTYPLHRSID